MIYEILKKFLAQAKAKDQKTKNYGSLFSHNLLKMDVSFGKGNDAEVAWISFLGYGQKNTHGIYPVYLYYIENETLVLAYGVSSTNKVDDSVSWKLKGVDTIAEKFGYSKYKESFVYKDYSWLLEKSDISESERNQLDEDFNSLVKVYIDRLHEIYEAKSHEYFNAKKIELNQNSSQKIFFGAPGTGKSHKIDAPAAEGGLGLKAIPENRKFRTTFHPDYDYAQFVGSYKPKKNGETVTYEFVPQVLANAYVAAWCNLNQPVYLVIEEINRGNCAQIFGDIFQLLDRDDNGESSYEIDADSDFAEWLAEKLKDCEIPGQAGNDIKQGKKLKLPPNFNILATMNTSDQSLFPMDSAFKRRFDWEYVPIKYEKDSECGESWNADRFVIDLGLGDGNPRWLDFLEKVNRNVYAVTKSEDKQMGEFFVKPDQEIDENGKKEKLQISLDMFKSKVLFYLWDSVYKDELDDENAQKVFHFDYPAEKGSAVTFQRLFKKKDESLEIIKQMFKNLGVEIKEKKES